jgi:TRAP-type uncharacterized transport system substrate-binding protein
MDSSSSAAPGRASRKAVSIHSLEHIVRSRVRLFLRHTWLVAFLGSVLLAGVAGYTTYFVTRAPVMRIAAGPEGGINARLVQIMAERFAHDRDQIDLQLVTTSGTEESTQALADHQVDLAVLPGNAKGSPDWPVVAILRQNVMALIVPAPDTPGNATKKAKAATSNKKAKTDKKADKAEKTDQADSDDKLEKVRQLSGHRIGIVTGNEANASLLNVVLSHYGVPLDKVQVSQIDPIKLGAAIRDNQVDVLFVAGPATGHAITDAVGAATRNGEAPTFIAIDQAEGIAKRNRAFDSIDIDAGTFGGVPPTPDDSLKSLSFPEYLVARKAFNHDHVATLARLLYSSRLSLAAEMPGEARIEAPSTDKDAQVIVHPGAHTYLTDDQKSFFDKYGDGIFYGLLIFPIFGSAIAGVASYFRNNGQTRRLRLLQRVLDLVRKAHAAASLEALDHLQADVDNLVIAIIHQSEHDDYDQSVQMSFSLALDQVRFAIAARRAALVDGVGAERKAAAA